MQTARGFASDNEGRLAVSQSPKVDYASLSEQYATFIFAEGQNLPYIMTKMTAVMSTLHRYNLKQKFTERQKKITMTKVQQLTSKIVAQNTTEKLCDYSTQLRDGN